VVEPTATTRLAAVIGSPIRHSRSPLLANAAFRAAEVDWVFLAFDVAAGRGAAAVEAARTLGIGGFMVTMPHKTEVIAALDELTPAAAALGAVNSIFADDERLIGDNTDGAGLVAALGHDGVEVTGRDCALIGAGGAGRSIAWALGEAGAGSVQVINRNPERAAIAAELAGPCGSIGTPVDITNADLVINATSVGMGADPTDRGAIPFDPDLMRRDQIVLDAVYQPLETPLLRAAADIGARPIDGLGMLVHQAAITIERWIGVPPDLDAMMAAARS